ncbi:MAG: hypothetical protein K2L04_01165 [Alistipes sp.]|nr:hypothetical protein [Alistipes sp.]
MACEEFERFKQEIRSWMDCHPDEYDAFVEEMNGKSFTGIQRVYMLAMRLAPQLMAKARRELHGDQTCEEADFVVVLADETLASQLVSEFHNTDQSSIVPAMLAWLYYGRCYETMVERLEELIEESENRINKWLCNLMIKFVIRGSIRNGMRTREDWERYRRERTMSPLDAAIDSLPPKDKEMLQPCPAQRTGIRRSDDRTLSALILADDKQRIIEKIRTRLASKSTQRDIAMMKVALEEAGITMNCSVRTFRDALQAEFPEYAIVLERGIQRCYKFLLDTNARTGKLQKDIGEDRILIDEIIRYFTDAE